VTIPVRPAIERMTGYTPGEQPQAGKFIKLNTNENPYPCSPAVKRAVGQVCQDGLHRYPDPLATAFRMRAGELLGVDPDWILCGNGSDDILTIVTRALVDPGESVRFAYPGYVLYRTLAEIQGAQCEAIQFEPDWTLGPKFSARSEGLKLVFLANPNSPSGTMLGPEQVRAIAAELSCPLLVDEAYVDFAEGDCLSLVAECANVMVSRSLSKSYALSGLRFGFLVARPAIIEQFRKVKDSYNCDSISIAGATAAIDDQAWLAENRAAILATRVRLTEAVRELGFAPVESQANFVWCPHPDLQLKPVYEQLKQGHILVRYMDFPGWGEGLRISVGTDEQIDALLARLKQVV